MESFATLKRRTTEVLQTVPQALPSKFPNMPNMPNVPNMPNMPKVSLPSMSYLPGMGGAPTDKNVIKASWERISIDSLPRSNHTLDVVGNTAYIFGGETSSRGGQITNDMHAVILPMSGASADYYSIRAIAAPMAAEYVPQEEGVISLEQDTARTGKEKDLTEISLTSPTTTQAPELPVINEPLRDDDEDAVSPMGEESAAQPSVSPGQSRADKGKGVASPSSPADKVPAARTGHASAVIGSRIFIFGGSEIETKVPLDERGRVWAFDTRTHDWTALDPKPSALPAPLTPLTLSSVAHPTYPSPRMQHCATATDRPGKPGEHGHSRREGGGSWGFNRYAGRRPSNWREWAEGDSAEVGTPQAPIVGNIAAAAVDEETDGYGTFFVHGGVLANDTRTNDVWAFDVHTRVWQQLPDAPGAGISGAAICVSRSRLYRFGGDIAALEYLVLGLDTFDDKSALGEEVSVTARSSSWRSLGEESDHTAEKTEQHPSPGPRLAHAMHVVSTGGGREYIVVLLGEGPESGQYCDDVWAYQVPAHGMTTASAIDRFSKMLRRKSGEGRWYRVEGQAFDEDDKRAASGPGPRGWMGAGGFADENAIVVWGGVDEAGRKLGDGWVLRLD